jgi:Domain of unknown function (DUF4328)
MTDIWVCSSCHSINRQRNAKCYKCGTSQSQATGEGSTLRVENALASRTMVRYRSAWLRGLIASVLILIVTALGVLLLLMSLDYGPWLRDQVDVIVAGGTLDEEALVAKLVPAVQIGLIRLGVSVLALVFFAAWLSRVIMNIPALGGGVPSTTPTKAFIYPLIPILNLIKVPGMIQDALYRVDPKAGGFFMVALAWFGLVGSWIIDFIAGWVLDIKLAGDLGRAEDPKEVSAALGTYFDLGFAVDTVTWIMVALGSLVLIGVMIRIERRSRARDQEIRAAALTPRPEPGSVEARPIVPEATRSVTPPAPAPTAPAAPTAPDRVAGRGPHLMLTVGDDSKLIAEMEGESEALSVDDLRAAAEALGRVGGTASIRIHGAGDAARSAASHAFQILGNSGVPTTFAS